MRVVQRESKAVTHQKLRKAIQREELWWNTYYDSQGNDLDLDRYDWRTMEENYTYIKRDYLDEPIPHCRQIDMDSFRGKDYLRDMKIRRLLKLDKDIIPRFGDLVKFD